MSIIDKLVVGDWILVHTIDGNTVTRNVQKFQMKKDPISGRWNHSMRYWGKVNGVPIVLEAAEKEFDMNDGKLLKAGTYFNKLENYLDKDKYELLILRPKVPYNEEKIKYLMMRWEGTPYDKKNLVLDQVVYYTLGWWIGRKKKKAHKQMVCHEVQMKIDNDYSGIFPNWHKAQISDPFHSPYFKHIDV